MKTFLITFSFKNNNVIRSMSFDCKTTEQAIKYAALLKLQVNAESFTLVMTDEKRQAA